MLDRKVRCQPVHDRKDEMQSWIPSVSGSMKQRLNRYSATVLLISGNLIWTVSPLRQGSMWQIFFTTLRRYEYNPDLMRLYIVGGGGCLIRNFGRYEESRVTIIDDICATAKGYEALALAALRRKERP